MIKIFNNGVIKFGRSETYNFNHHYPTGDFYRWGKTEDDDPDYCEHGPEILDLEISAIELTTETDIELTKCSGKCPFCYKGNNKGGKVHNMTLAEFENIINKMPGTLTQIAFGLCDVDTNPDFIPMMEMAREKRIIPNFTCNGIGVTEEFAATVKRLCGACAVSLVKKDTSYDAIKKITDAGMDQCNIHYMLSEQTYDNAFKVLDDIKNDPRLSKLNAIVFLQYKHKNLDSPFTSMLDKEKYKVLIKKCIDDEIPFGFDSCSANFIMDCVKEMDYSDEFKEQFNTLADPCESTCFSSYINCHGDFYPCSFCEEMKFKDQDWTNGINVLESDHFKHVWNDPKTIMFREGLIKNCRNCPIYDI